MPESGHVRARNTGSRIQCATRSPPGSKFGVVLKILVSCLTGSQALTYRAKDFANKVIDRIEFTDALDCNGMRFELTLSETVRLLDFHRHTVANLYVLLDCAVVSNGHADCDICEHARFLSSTSTDSITTDFIVPLGSVHKLRKRTGTPPTQRRCLQSHF